MEELPDVALDVGRVGRVQTRSLGDRRKINAVDLGSGMCLSKVAGYDAGAAADVEDCLRDSEGGVEGFVVHQLGETECLVLKASVFDRAVEALDRIWMKREGGLLIRKGILCFCGMISWLTTSCVRGVIAAYGFDGTTAWIGWVLAFDVAQPISLAEIVG